MSDFQDDGSEHGKGSKTYPSGDVYKGEFVRGMRWGNGRHVFALDKSVYDGFWARDLRNGHGTYALSRLLDPSQPKDAVANTRHGSAVHLRVLYEGNWVDDKKHGRGVFTQQQIYSLTRDPVPKTTLSYAGEWCNDQKHGQGVEVLPDGSFYGGFWKADERHDRRPVASWIMMLPLEPFLSAMYSALGSTSHDESAAHDKLISFMNRNHASVSFQHSSAIGSTLVCGQWKHSSINGVARAEYACGDVYVGGWKNDTREGLGLYRYAEDGCMFIGDWKNGRKHGKGICWFTSRSTPSVLEFEENTQVQFPAKKPESVLLWTSLNAQQLETRFAKYWFSDDAQLDGRRNNNNVGSSSPLVNSVEDLPIRKLTDGISTDRYDGEWFEDQMHGVGIYFSARTGDVFEGEFRSNLRQGKGTLRYGVSRPLNEGEDVSSTVSSGGLYVGQFSANRRHGQGRMEWADGSVYEGEWRDDIRHGRGTMSFILHSDSTISGKSTEKRKRKYEGDWAGDKPHGQGTMVYSDGSSYSGTWVQGERYFSGVEKLVSAFDAGVSLTSLPTTESSSQLSSSSSFSSSSSSSSSSANKHAVSSSKDNVVSTHGQNGDEEEYDGEFRGSFSGNVREGSGMLTNKRGDRYEGRWVRGVPVGKARLVRVLEGRIPKLLMQCRLGIARFLSPIFAESIQEEDELAIESVDVDWVVPGESVVAVAPKTRRTYEGGFRGMARHGAGTEKYHYPVAGPNDAGDAARRGITIKGSWWSDKRQGVCSLKLNAFEVPQHTVVSAMVASNAKVSSMNCFTEAFHNLQQSLAAWSQGWTEVIFEGTYVGDARAGFGMSIIQCDEPCAEAHYMAVMCEYCHDRPSSSVPIIVVLLPCIPANPVDIPSIASGIIVAQSDHSSPYFSFGGEAVYVSFRSGLVCRGSADALGFSKTQVEVNTAVDVNVTRSQIASCMKLQRVDGIFGTKLQVDETNSKLSSFGWISLSSWVFKGECERNLPSGFGILRLDSQYYEGSWYNGCPHGRGICRQSLAAVYSPTVVDILLYFSNRDAHQPNVSFWEEIRGAFDSGLPDGLCKTRYYCQPETQSLASVSDQCLVSIYEGTYARGVRSGKGKISFIERGHSYEGGFDNQYMHGQGMLSFSAHYLEVKAPSASGEFPPEFSASTLWNHSDERGGGSYQGEFSKGEMNGKGVRKYANGDVYQGDFSAGARYGLGRISLSAAVSFVGPWVNDLPSGEGELIDDVGNVYRGAFLFGRKHGHGVLQYASGALYDGPFVADVREGSGAVYTDPLGNVYRGDFSGDMMCGYGRIFYISPAGSEYEGQFRDGVAWGRGEYRQPVPGETGPPKQLVYTGSFERGKGNGHGRLCVPGVGTYDGEFKEGFRWGKGVFSYETGDVYEGEFVRDQMTCPKASIRYATQDTYVGSVVDGLKSGIGKQVIVATSLEGVTSATGSSAGAPDIIEYDGGFLEDEREGNGVMVFQRSGITVSGKWSGGVPQTPLVVEWPGSIPRTSLLSAQFMSSASLEDGTQPDISLHVRLASNSSFTLGSASVAGQLHRTFVLEWDCDDSSFGGISASFCGRMRNGLIDGHGELRCLHAAYKGEFKECLRHGQGTTTYSRSSSFGRSGHVSVTVGTAPRAIDSILLHAGYYREDKYHGPGTVQWSDGSSYNGEFFTGLRHGSGTMSFSSSAAAADATVILKQYSGEWISDVPTQGRLSFAVALEQPSPASPGSSRHDSLAPMAPPQPLMLDVVWDGPVDDAFRPHGSGLWWSSKIVYYGPMIAGERQGEGWLWDATKGECFTGSFLKNLYNGHGTLKVGRWPRSPFLERLYQLGVRIPGHNNESLRELIGHEDAQVDSVYEGTFVDGQRDGNGRQTYASGDVFEGRFAHGKRKWGRMRYANGQIYEGEFS
eukprot:ANDGO_01892.mRNA.1 hypothetical protein